MAPNQTELMVAFSDKGKALLYVNYADQTRRVKIHSDIWAVARYAQTPGSTLDDTVLEPEVVAALTDSQGRSRVPAMAQMDHVAEYRHERTHQLQF